jgi:hypothetical protein
VAYQTVESIEDLKLQIAAREQAETAVRALASGLEAKIRRLVNANIIGIFIWSLMAGSLMLMTPFSELWATAATISFRAVFGGKN